MSDRPVSPEGPAASKPFLPSQMTEIIERLEASHAINRPLALRFLAGIRELADEAQRSRSADSERLNWILDHTIDEFAALVTDCDDVRDTLLRAARSTPAAQET